MRGPTTLSRYYNSDAAAADEEGWFDTGDVATIDSYGYMQVCAAGGSCYNVEGAAAMCCMPWSLEFCLHPQVESVGSGTGGSHL